MRETHVPFIYLFIYLLSFAELEFVGLQVVTVCDGIDALENQDNRQLSKS